MGPPPEGGGNVGHRFPNRRFSLSFYPSRGPWPSAKEKPTHKGLILFEASDTIWFPLPKGGGPIEAVSQAADLGS